MNFRQSLQQFRAGLLAIDHVRSALAFELSESPESAGRCRELLDTERSAGWLDDDVHAELQATITQADMPPHAAADDDRTRLHPTTGIPSTAVSHVGQPTVGTVLGGQFKLEQELGRGGMGVVFKALDLKAQAANDRNPYVAIKVLSAQFKEHPESLIQMQREAKKAQSLAHPNIVNVFIFNFDENCAWIVMEYLDGFPLDQLRGKRLPRAKAISYIEQMVNALTHAHNMKPHPIVHYDLKPANAFLTDDDVVKLLDFGIARAAPVGRVASEDQTMFDPGALGALTPSYASCEMIRGMEPDPRDDVYGLACVAYFLLTGEHPFDRCPATDAQAARMKPLPRGLSRREYKALSHALEFVRSKRTRSAAQFLRELKPPENRTMVKVLAAAAATVFLIVGISAPVWLPRAQEGWRVYQLAQSLSAQSQAELEQSVAVIETLSAKDVQRIFADQANVDRLLAYYRARIGAVFDPAEGAYGYATAIADIEELRDILPDSPDVEALAEEVEGSRNAELQRLRSLAAIAARNEQLMPGDGELNLPVVLAAIRLLNAYDSELADSRIAGRYFDAVEAALLRQDFGRAERLVETGHSLVSEDAARAQLRLAASRIEQTRSGSVVSEGNAVGAGILTRFNSALTARDYGQAGELLAAFGESGVSETLTREATDRLASAYLAQARELANQGDLDGAEAMIESGLGLAPGSELQASFRILKEESIEREQAQYEERRNRALAAIASTRADLGQRLDAATFGIDDVGWATDTLARLASMGANTTGDRERVVQRIVDSGDALIASGSTAEAFNLGKYADALFPGSTSIRDLNERVEAAMRKAREKPESVAENAPEPGSLDALNRRLDELLANEALDEPSLARRIRAQLRVLERSGADMNDARRRVGNAALARASAFDASGLTQRADAHRAMAAEYGATVAATTPADSTEDFAAVRAAFESAIASGDPVAGAAEFQRLLALGPASDPYLLNDAPEKLVDAYVEAALAAGRGRDYDTALGYLSRARDISPDDPRAIRYEERFTRLRDAL